MINFIKALCCLLVSSLAMAAPTALPKSIQLKYEVTKNGQPFATVKERFEVVDHTYTIESVTKGIGVYALFGERKLSSTGEVTAEGLKPARFELHQGDNEKKSLISTFDWQKNSLTMLIKGNEKKADLVVGTQDLASYAYQWMFIASQLQNKVEVDLTTGKKLNHYRYDIAPVNLEILGKSTTTLHLVPAKEGAAGKELVETKEFWLAETYHFLPVQILIVDENGQKLVQTLTEFNAN